MSDVRAGSGWNDVWQQRQARADDAGSLLERLLLADGYDTGFGAVDQQAWRTFIMGWAQRLGIGAGGSVFEIGCGAGAALLPLAEAGCAVSGIDLSPGLIELATRVMPDGLFAVADAVEVAVEPSVDVVLSFGVFCYFPSLDYAVQVLERAAEKARCAGAIFDLPNLATRDEAIAERVAVVGGHEAYAQRYSGLDHRYYDREWFESALRHVGLVDVASEDQSLPRYANGRFRFNAWGRVPA